MLWDAVKGFHPLTLDAFVPPGTAPLTEVIHEGRNTLPAIVHGGRHFQKRICKPSKEGATELYGYNQNFGLSRTASPGYFVVVPGDADGEVNIDYRRVPSEKPAGWPEIETNDTGFIRKLAHGGMEDVMRGISNHVTIGRARRGGQPMDAWFVLCRKDP